MPPPEVGPTLGSALTGVWSPHDARLRLALAGETGGRRLTYGRTAFGPQAASAARLYKALAGASPGPKSGFSGGVLIVC